MLNRPISDVCN